MVEPVAKAEKKRGPFSSISFPIRLTKEVERVVKELGYWSTKTAFIHEAVIRKLEMYKNELEAKKGTAKEEG